MGVIITPFTCGPRSYPVQLDGTLLEIGLLGYGAGGIQGHLVDQHPFVEKGDKHHPLGHAVAAAGSHAHLYPAATAFQPYQVAVTDTVAAGFLGVDVA